MGDWIGFLFFSGIAFYAAVKGIREESPWMGLPLLHNGVIAVLFLVRKPARKEDGAGLVLAILAVFCPTGTGGVPSAGIWGLLGLLGLILIFWSLGTLGTSFGLAPADRGLVTGGPYRYIRHPMYLGELVYQAAALGMNISILRIGIFIVFAVLQVARIQREELLIENYPGYAQKVRWRLLFGIW
jgi:protein-S-isoprenylcysteine O-methyltransferase Ste14